MKKYFPFLFVIFIFSCKEEKSIIRDTISFEISTYQDSTQMKASAMPVLKVGSELIPYRRRFEYLLMNIPEIFGIDKFNARDSINSLYPDTIKIKEVYMDRFCQDKKFVNYFEQSYAAIHEKNSEKETYSSEELMEVASKFFYCDLVRPDSSVQMHVCIGFNGVKEAKWEKDYTLVAAFCLEAIFNDLENDNSKIRETYGSEKEEAVKKYRNNITTLDKYLKDVRLDLFGRMKSNTVLKEALFAYYESNENNLAFKILK